MAVFQVENMRGHSGRRTFVSTAINAGVDSQIVANASNHKDVNSVKKYYEPDQYSCSRPSVACGTTSMRANQEAAAELLQDPNYWSAASAPSCSSSSAPSSAGQNYSLGAAPASAGLQFYQNQLSAGGMLGSPAANKDSVRTIVINLQQL